MAASPEAALAAVEPERALALRPKRSRAWGRWWQALWTVLEIVLALAAAAVLPIWAGGIDVDPLDRTGQVSGLAAVQLRFAIVAGALVAVLLLAHWVLPARHRHVIARLGCAVAAGLASGVVAAGIVVAMLGTRWALWTGGGDYTVIIDWVQMLRAGQDIPDHYPPLILYIIDEVASASDLPPRYALQGVQVAGTALFGPAAYLCWRLVLRPGWALGIGVVAMLPFIEPVKPYPQITLVMLVPVVIAFVSRIRHAGDRAWYLVVVTGVLFGAGFGLLFLLYSGWFVWVAPGVVLATLLLVPWRAAPGRALVMLGCAAGMFLTIVRVHLGALFSSTGGSQDAFFYNDTETEPAYIAMWTNDREAWTGPVWPPPGELGGVGLFTVMLAAGLGVAIWLGWRRTAVIVLVAGVASAWVTRMWLASEMYELQLVRLYPRTTMIILYSLLILTGLAVRYGGQALSGRPPATGATGGLALSGRALSGRAPAAAATAPAGLLLLPLLFLFASAGSALADRYMPDPRLNHPGYFTYVAHTIRHYDGTCPEYGEQHHLCR